MSRAAAKLSSKESPPAGSSDSTRLPRVADWRSGRSLRGAETLGSPKKSLNSSGSDLLGGGLVSKIFGRFPFSPEDFFAFESCSAYE